MIEEERYFFLKSMGDNILHYINVRVKETPLKRVVVLRMVRDSLNEMIKEEVGSVKKKGGVLDG